MNHLKKLQQLIFKKDNSGYYKTPLSQKTAINFEQKREMATGYKWGGVARIEEPGKPHQAPLEKKYDPETGAEMMDKKDFSGVNHSLLRNFDYKHPTNPELSEIHGVFTSSTKPIDGIHPEMIDSHTFEGKATPQFFVRYLKPKLIPTNLILECPLVDLSSEHIQEFLTTLEKKDKYDE